MDRACSLFPSIKFYLIGLPNPIPEKVIYRMGFCNRAYYESLFHDINLVSHFYKL